MFETAETFLKSPPDHTSGTLPVSRDTKDDERPAFYENDFIDVSSVVRNISVNPAFRYNADLSRQVKGWPDQIDPHPFCQFSVPSGPIRHMVHDRMGRGQSKSILSNVVPGNKEKIKPGSFGVFDPDTGMFYPDFGTKGNGPTANEMYRVTGQHAGADFRMKSDEPPWGLLDYGTAIYIEQDTLDTLAQMGFRVGRVPVNFSLDGKQLAKIVDPLYKAANLDEIYSVKRELNKKRGYFPDIMVRLIGGVRADLMANPKVDPNLITDGLYGLASELTLRGWDQFIQYYRFPQEMYQDLRIIMEHDLFGPLNSGLASAYLKITSFLMWRNYHMQDEYNEKFPLNSKEVVKILEKNVKNFKLEKYPFINDKLGQVWLNYKPGDWDIGAYMFDVDVFIAKLALAANLSAKSVRATDAEVLNIGLQQIGMKLNSIT